MSISSRDQIDHQVTASVKAGTVYNYATKGEPASTSTSLSLSDNDEQKEWYPRNDADVLATAFLLRRCLKGAHIPLVLRAIVDAAPYLPRAAARASGPASHDAGFAPYASAVLPRPLPAPPVRLAVAFTLDDGFDGLVRANEARGGALTKVDSKWVLGRTRVEVGRPRCFGAFTPGSGTAYGPELLAYNGFAGWDFARDAMVPQPVRFQEDVWAGQDGPVAPLAAFLGRLEAGDSVVLAAYNNGPGTMVCGSVAVYFDTWVDFDRMEVLRTVTPAKRQKQTQTQTKTEPFAVPAMATVVF